jgi:hypothetical protein
MLDPIATIREHLASDVTLNQLVGGRIFCPAADAGGLPCISFQIISGVGHSETDIMKPIVLIRSWAPAKSQILARQIDRAIYDAIGRSDKGSQITTTSGFIQTCYLLTPGQDLVDPDTKFSVVQALYQYILNTV